MKAVANRPENSDVTSQTFEDRSTLTGSLPPAPGGVAFGDRPGRTVWR